MGQAVPSVDLPTIGTLLTLISPQILPIGLFAISPAFRLQLLTVVFRRPRCLIVHLLKLLSIKTRARGSCCCIVRDRSSRLFELSCIEVIRALFRVIVVVSCLVVVLALQALTSRAVFGKQCRKVAKVLLLSFLTVATVTIRVRVTALVGPRFSRSVVSMPEAVLTFVVKVVCVVYIVFRGSKVC